MTKREGTQIGPYILLQLLGEGAMGAVYLAQQQEPLQRRVALKVLKHGLDFQEVGARFEAEREALARMNHPGVAAVFESGVTDDGRPYFVMEYVPGIPITDFCNQHELTLQERLGLFVQVCGAIHHAHQKGILHRDIKPSNILVAQHEGRPAAKVIDFGIAKAVQDPLTENTLFTEDGVLMGTPEYVSPEQAGAIAGDVDTRSDVYSLGVLFYELLVGAPPLDVRKLRQAAMSEMLRLIAEEAPQKPSLRIAEMGQSAEMVARQRRTNARALARSLRGDIEWIVLRALEKEPGRRYSTASELAADVARHLAQEPVVAGPPGIRYRIRKLVSKHRAAAAGVAATIVTLVFGVIGSTVLYLQAENDVNRMRILSGSMLGETENDPEQKAAFTRQWVDWHRRSLGESMEFVRWMLNDLLLDDMDRSDKIALGREAVGIMERAFNGGDSSVIETFRKFRQGFSDDPFTDGLMEKVSDLLKKEWKEADATGRRRLVDSLEYFAAPYSAAKAGDVAAEHLLREILLVRRAGANTSPDPGLLSNALRNMADVLATLGSDRYRERKAAEAVPLLREALALWQELEFVQANSDDRDRISERVLAIESELGAALAELREFDEAHVLLSRGYSELRRRRGPESSATQIALGRLIDYYNERGLQKDAVRYESLRSAITLRDIRDVGSVFLLSPNSSDYSPQGTLNLSVTMGSRSVWIFQSLLSWSGRPVMKWGVRLESSPEGFRVRESSASLEAKPFLGLTETESAFNTDHLLENCAGDDCQSAWSLFVRSATADPVHNRALITYSKDLLDFSGRPKHAGTSLAVWQDPEAPADRVKIRPDSAEPALMFGADEPEWGSAALTGDGLLYSYACSETSKGKKTSTCLLAKVPLDRALDREAWQFYTGAGWNADWRRARPVLRLDGAGTLAVHWNAYLKKYLAICTSPVEGRIRLRVASRPEGPWSESLVGLDLLEGRPSMAYAGMGHPELARDDGRIEYVTYFGDGRLRVLEIEFK
jgi:serine/threonine protein kinase